MCKTDFRLAAKTAALAGAVAMGIFCSGASAQTIAEVAERQRSKLQADANPTPPAATAPVHEPLPKVKAPAPTPWRLYGIYAVGQKIGAEIIYGGELLQVEKGSILGHYRVVEVSLSFIKIETHTACGRKCPATRVVTLGDAF